MKMNSTNDQIKEEILLRDHYIRNNYTMPDVDEEWSRFNKSKVSLGTKIFLSGGAVAAATIISFFFLINKPKLSDVITDDSYKVFAANVSQENIIIKSNDGEILFSDDVNNNNITETLGAIYNWERSEIIYNESSVSGAKNIQTIITPRRKEFKVVLSDGSEVWINGESELSYPACFEGKERKVKLSGEAYFKISPDKDKPFIVETNGLSTTVLGTEFNISSYNTTNPTVTLISGSVEINNPVNSLKCQMHSGESLTLNDEGTFDIVNVDTESYIQWKDGYFYYDDIPLKDIMIDIGRWYNMDIVFNSVEIMDLKLHFIADRHGPIEDLVYLLNSIGKTVVKIENNTIYIN